MSGAGRAYRFAVAAVAGAVVLLGVGTGRVSAAELLELDFSPPAEMLAFHLATAQPEAAGQLAIADRTVLRPGERWGEMMVNLEPFGRELAGFRLRAVLSDYLTGAKKREIEVVPGGRRALLRVDLRAAGMRQAQLRVELRRGNTAVAVGQAVFTVTGPEGGWPKGGIPVAVDFPDGAAGQAWPVSFGAPAPAGVVWEADEISLVDGHGRPVPAQRDVTARWAPDGAVKWLRFEALAKPGMKLFAVTGRGAAASPPRPVVVSRKGGVVTVETAGVRYVLRPGHSPICEIYRDGRLLATAAGARGLYAVDQAGRLARAAADNEMRVEAAGPVAACVRFEGFYRTAKGEALARHITRVEVIAGRPEARVTHTLVLSRDSNKVWFREIGWELAVAPGAEPRAVFSAGRASPDALPAVPLAPGASAYVFQASGARLGFRPRADRTECWETVSLGTNRFAVKTGAGRALHRGVEMGDWAALTGAGGGLLVNCREAARQHPKEFELAGDRLNLKLFSNRGGQELDFRTPSLVERWGLNKLHREGKVDVRRWPNRMKKILSHSSNAVGWSKTHEMLFAPLPAGAAPETLSSLSRLHSERVYAHVDPAWICRSRVFRGIHPRDRRRFPEAEAAVDAVLKPYLKLLPGDWLGFTDYYAGPHYSFPGRYRILYTFLEDVWMAYARSGDRRLRALIEGSSRAYQDNYIAHWGGPGKIRGWYILAVGGRGGAQKSDFPFYWEGIPHISGPTPALTHSLIDYWLTGNRRAGDVARRYGEAFLGFWGPQYRSSELPRSVFGRRRHMHMAPVVSALAECYSLSWDPRLRAMAEALTTQGVYDPEGAIRMAKTRRPYRSTIYKTMEHLDGMIVSWDVLGSRRHLEMACAVAREKWERAGNGESRLTGAHAGFLYDVTRDPGIVAGLQYHIRDDSRTLHVGGYRVHNPADRSYGNGASRMVRRVAYAEDVIVRAAGAAGTDDLMRPPVAWLAFNADTAPVRLFVHKPGDPGASVLSPYYDHKALRNTETALELLLRRQLGGDDVKGTAHEKLVPFGGKVELKPHAVTLKAYPWGGQDMHRISETSGGIVKVRIPKDAPGGVYEIVSRRAGDYAVFADRRVPLAIYAPGGWRPAGLKPPAPVYFRVPEGSAGRIFFEKGVRLFTPDGKPFRDGAALSGWVDLPGSQAGLWRFESSDPGLVRTEKLPGFFAQGDPAFYLEHEVE